MKYPSLVILDCPLSSPTLWELSGIVLSLIVGFFGGLLTWTTICFTFNRCSFRYHGIISLFMWGFRGKDIVISSSYHIFILFICNPLHYNITYLSWLTTSYDCPYFTMSMWLYHWQSRYSFVLVPLWEWVYNNPWYILGYCRNCYLGKWNTCSERSFPPFPSPHSMTSGYPYHQR
jgi:hypothetical protein